MSVKRRALRGLGQGLQQGAQSMMQMHMRRLGQPGDTPMGLPQADIEAGTGQISDEMQTPDLSDENQAGLMRMLEQMFKQRM